ncbi:MAG: hypothetical protein QOD76_1051 [Solirubrobacteraceae bacterium]|nr:hypothetical protein [Solirubrobacteraceae bacterium]
MTPQSATRTAGTKDGTAATAKTPVERRAGDLRELAVADPVAARSEAWRWFEDAGRRAGSDRKAADAELNELFRLGKPASGLDGPMDGILVMTTISGVVDPAARLITRLWMPWQGKSFHADADRGENRLVGSARWPAKLLWPRYSMRGASEGLLAFDFETYVEAGKVDPDREVLVIDYAPVDDNPGLVIKSIRDELVEIVPGAYLGKILYRTGEDRHRNLGYFALRTPS